MSGEDLDELDALLYASAETFDVTVEALISRSRKRNLVTARIAYAVSAYLAGHDAGAIMSRLCRDRSVLSDYKARHAELVYSDETYRHRMAWINSKNG